MSSEPIRENPGDQGRPGHRPAPRAPTITELSVAGFKSIRDEIKLSIRPLTVLAGANSSGKTSLLQPLLLLKQTVEAPYDPGPLLLNGPHVAFQQVREIIPHCWREERSSVMDLGIRADPFHIAASFRLTPDVPPGVELLYKGEFDEILRQFRTQGLGEKLDLTPKKNRFLWNLPVNSAQFAVLAALGAVSAATDAGAISRAGDTAELAAMANLAYLNEIRGGILPWCLHLPGLRGRPERAYPLTVAGPLFPGPFPSYTASVIAGWQRGQAQELTATREDLVALRLTSTVEAIQINDTQVSLRVGRLVTGRGATELVDISDVGVGVSQVLPVIVALHAAAPGALVYIEQPELHLHPGAQLALAGVLVSALKRGIRLVIETHSSLLLTGLQTEVAEGRLAPGDVNLSWSNETTKAGRRCDAQTCNKTERSENGPLTSTRCSSRRGVASWMPSTKNMETPDAHRAEAGDRHFDSSCCRSAGVSAPPGNSLPRVPGGGEERGASPCLVQPDKKRMAQAAGGWQPFCFQMGPRLVGNDGQTRPPLPPGGGGVPRSIAEGDQRQPQSQARHDRGCSPARRSPGIGSGCAFPGRGGSGLLAVGSERDRTVAQGCLGQPAPRGGERGGMAPGRRQAQTPPTAGSATRLTRDHQAAAMARWRP